MGLFDWLSGLFSDSEVEKRRKQSMVDAKKQLKIDKVQQKGYKSRPLDNLPTYGAGGGNSGNNSYRDLSSFNIISEPSYTPVDLYSIDHKHQDTHTSNHSHSHGHGSSGSSSWSDSSSSGSSGSSSYDSGSSSSSSSDSCGSNDSGSGSCGGGSCD